MLYSVHLIMSIVLLSVICEETVTKRRTRRYLLFTPATQWGVFATVSIPLHPETYVSVAWFYEANYYNVANATYFDALLGDIETVSRGRKDRSVEVPKAVMTRSSIYTFIESMLRNFCPWLHSWQQKNVINEEPTDFEQINNLNKAKIFGVDRHGYPGRPCLLRLICENADAHFLHNGLIGDLIYLVLTPSASMSEDDISDSFYEAEYYGLDNKCRKYTKRCPTNLLETFSLYADGLV